MVRTEMGADYDVDTHFTPVVLPVGPAAVPRPQQRPVQGDPSRARRRSSPTRSTRSPRPASSSRRATSSMPTSSSRRPGLQLVTLGEMDFAVDGEPVDFSKTWTYKGFAYSDVPNLASSFGYINASWTLRADLICEYVCRLAQPHGATPAPSSARRALRASDADMPERDLDRRLLVRLHAAGDAHAPQAGRPRAVDQPAGLPPRQEDVQKSPVADGVMRFGRSRAKATTDGATTDGATTNEATNAKSRTRRLIRTWFGPDPGAAGWRDGSPAARRPDRCFQLALLLLGQPRRRCDTTVLVELGLLRFVDAEVRRADAGGVDEDRAFTTSASLMCMRSYQLVSVPTMADASEMRPRDLSPVGSG